MIVAVLFVAGLVLGWTRAARRGGNTADRVQFALAHGIPAALVGIIGSVLVWRLGLG